MSQSILLAIVGGVLLGVSVSMMMFFVGKIGGISGILGGGFNVLSGDTTWRLFFLGGMLVGGLLLQLVSPSVFSSPIGHSSANVILAGLLVGLGTRIGNGCTSGHGICGLSRFSLRSFVATLTFVVAGVLVATFTSNFS